MDGLELLRNWPSWQHLNAARVLASPAWRLNASYGGWRATVKLVPPPAVVDALWLDVRFDDEPHRLGILDCEGFFDLHRLWSRRNELPPEVLLALVEKECGTVLQLVEDAFRRQLTIVGLSDCAAAEDVSSFDVDVPGRELGSLGFLLDLSKSMEIDLGRFENVDVAHETIRTMTRPVEIVCAHLDLMPDDLRGLAVGDCLLLPEAAAPTWQLEEPAAASVRILAEEPGEVTFAALADEALAAPTMPTALRLTVGTRTLAHGVRTRLGAVSALRVERLEV